MSFRNFARMIEKNYPSVLDKITDLLRDYRWLPTQEGNPPLTRLYYLRALYQDLQRPFPKLKEDFKLQREVLKKFDRQRHSVERELQMPSKIRYLAATVRILAKIRMDVRLARTESDFLGRSLRMEIAKRLRMSSYELEFLTTNELTAALRGKKVDRQQLEKRKNFYVWEIKDGKESIHTGKVARSVLTVLLDQEKNIQASNEIAGLAASPGKVRGIVKIISPLSKKQYKDCEEMKQGQILVTGQTRPHLMVAVRKAAAIVTDEGGMSSHSALVSREFGIPCVVGTHNATKLLHDGDLVEVDAFAGKVNIIQKKP
ncbi:MAG: hypothetical protein HY397_00925 [Candidatus Doudnabacteria bacterium]|nr:hypothetical protein [Candidatus Doudnabacteria bacterium]